MPNKTSAFILTGVLVWALGISVIPVSAYPPQIEILDESEITNLSDTQLRDRYIDTVVELEAMRAFHTTSGFTPKDYEAFKKVVRYKILLLDEINKRELDVPRTE